MAQTSTTYQFVRVDGSKIILKDKQGSLYRIDVAATDYKPSTSNPGPTPLPSAPPVTGGGLIPVTAPSQHSAEATSDWLDAPSSDDVAAINALFGARLFGRKNLWEEKDSAVAIRLGWPQDGNSSILASYRLRDQRQAPNLHLHDLPDSSDPTELDNSSTPDPSVTVDRSGQTLINYFHSHAYSCTLYSRQGHPDFISLIFANRGDISLVNDHNINRAATSATMEKTADDAIKRERTFLNQELTNLLGPPSSCTFGATGVSEPAHRWDWHGSTILLTLDDRYTGIIICPAAFADRHGIRENQDRLNSRATLTAHLHTSPNGDVLIEDIPAVNQGDIAYCVPAVCEKYCRYLDIPCDMYIFASIFNTQLGGVTKFSDMEPAMNAFLQPYDGTIVSLGDSPTMANVQECIDKGQPIIWNCTLDDSVEKQIRDRMTVRPPVEDANPTDWEKYNQVVQIDNANLKNPTWDQSYRAKVGHTRLIVGYNKTTSEIAFSETDGYSKPYWITLEEAQYVHDGYLSAIQFP